MQKRANHLIAIKAFTRQSLPIPVPSGTSWESAVKTLLEKWEDERTGYLSVRSPISFETLFERSRQQKGIFPLIAEERAAVKSFAYYPSLGILQIRDAKGVILGYRFKIPPHLLTTLNNSSQTLNSYEAGTSRGGGRDRLRLGPRGLYETRHYAVWADYSKKYVESQELLEDGEKGREWLRENQELFDYCSNQLRFLCPEQYVRLTGSVVKDMAKTQNADGARKLRPLGGAWHEACLNQGMDSKSGSRCHQDWLDDKRLFNCVAPFGEGFEGGELVLWQMKMRIGLEIGDGFFFYGSLVAHEVMDITTGVRNSIDLFTHASNFELLAKHEKAAANKVKHLVKEKLRATRKKEERRKVEENAGARSKIQQGKKLRQSAACLMKNKSGM
ncbi:hypothetical protein B9Z19DRAFT_1095376 [Tuber borchii]|uniref:Uncharacterized protein n=1 Tax=Tuber borchii TaxID=42251 RepID=A0A2T6ZCT1_TUBBO|nr:hypothetical protein B9Z19DRAFT_1095376 [Tuber borchii]